MVLTKIKISDEVYCHNRIRYTVVCLPESAMAARGRQGGVGLVFQERLKDWSIESTRFHRPNMVRCEVVSGV